jgi:hypothetical protein
VGHDGHVVQLQQGRVDLGLALEHVQAGRPQLAGPQGLGQGGLVDDRAPGGVDQHGRRLHAGQPLGPDQVLGGRRQPGVDAHEVGLGQQLVQLAPGHAQGGLAVAVQPPAGGVEDRHAEPGGPPGHRLADAAQADHPQGLAVDLEAEEELRPPDPRLLGPQVPVPLGDPPGRGQQQRPGQVGGGLGDHVGGVGGQHPPGRARLQVEVVVADGEVGHHPQPGAGPLQQLAVDPVGQHGQEPVHARDPLQQLAPGHDPFALPNLQPAAPGQVPADPLWHPASDQHGGHAGILVGRQCRGAVGGGPDHRVMRRRSMKAPTIEMIEGLNRPGS